MTTWRSYGSNPLARTARRYVPGGTSPCEPRNGIPLSVTRAPAGRPWSVRRPTVPGGTRRGRGVSGGGGAGAARGAGARAGGGPGWDNRRRGGGAGGGAAGGGGGGAPGGD